MKMDTGYLNLFFLHRYVSLNKTFLPMKRLVLIPTIFALIGRPINAVKHGDSGVFNRMCNSSKSNCSLINCMRNFFKVYQSIDQETGIIGKLFIFFILYLKRSKSTVQMVYFYWK